MEGEVTLPRPRPHLNQAVLLAALAAAGAGVGVDFGLPPMGAPRKRYVPRPVDHEAECRKFHGKVLVHRVTGNRRKVSVGHDAVWFFDYRGNGKSFVRSFRKALDWIRNADVVREA